MTRFFRRWRQRLTGPLGRRLLLALAVAVTWLAWQLAPPRPLREWATTGYLPLQTFLSADRTRFACLTCRFLIDKSEPRPNSMHYPIRLWDLATGYERVTTEFTPVEAPFHLCMSPDGSWLLTERLVEMPPGLALQLWDAETGRERWSVPIDGDPTYLDRFVLSPDGRFVACRHGATAEVLVPGTGQVHRALGDGWPLAFAPDGRSFATIGPDPAAVTVWDLTSGQPRTRLTLKHQDPVAAAFSPDGRWLAVKLWQKVAAPPSSCVVELWDLHRSERAAELDCGDEAYSVMGGLSFRAGGSLLVAPSVVGTQRLWDVTQLPPRVIDISGALDFAGLMGALNVAASYPVFSPDGTRFVGPGPDEDTLVFRETAVPERATSAHAKVRPIDRPAFAPDGRSLAILRLDWFQPLWRQAANWLSTSVGWSPPFEWDVRYELVAFDATTGAVAGRVGGFEARTRLIGFGPDGRTVWTMSHIPDSPLPNPWSEPARPLPETVGTLRVQEWAVPTGWPPLWLVAVTTLGAWLIIADWRRSRRRAMTGGTTS
jgi:WD40 repeat protein